MEWCKWWWSISSFGTRTGRCASAPKNSIHQTIETVTTNSEGAFAFAKVQAGNYYIKFDVPVQYSFSHLQNKTLNGINTDADGTMGYGTTALFNITELGLVKIFLLECLKQF